MEKLTDKELIEELRSRMIEKTVANEELKILNDKLRNVNKKLEESERMKSHFISNITNEIVNPFSSIIGLSRSILNVDKENWKRVLSMIAMIHSEALSLDFQLKNIFIAARLEAGELYPEIGSTDIISLTRSVVDSFIFEAKKKNVTFSIHFPEGDAAVKLGSFMTDPEKIKLVLSNLINNAVKFSYENSVITLNAHIEGKELFLSVVNNGVEISQEHQQLIFDRFKRIDTNITSVNRGHGLGLSVVRSLLDILGGEVVFKSDSTNGTIFTIIVPEASADDVSFSSSLNGNEIFFEENQVF
jgi:signal transduction histidine kinase